jgi:hypothetical protein
MRSVSKCFTLLVYLLADFSFVSSYMPVSLWLPTFLELRLNIIASVK